MKLNFILKCNNKLFEQVLRRVLIALLMFAKFCVGADDKIRKFIFFDEIA